VKLREALCITVSLELTVIGCQTAPHDTSTIVSDPSPPYSRVFVPDAALFGTPGPAAPRGSGAPWTDRIALERVVDGLVGPTAMAVAADGTMVVLDQPGMAYRIESGSGIAFADLRDRVTPLKRGHDERGLLGLAFHPDFPSDRRVFVRYSALLQKDAPERFDHTNVLAAFEVAPDGTLDPNTENRLLAIDWPYSNHVGGALAFGPDRMLYVALGDGGNHADLGLGHPPRGNGQDRSTLMGSILRIDIDPDGGEPYGIPEDNPFVDDPKGAEVWAYGLRDVHGLAFDPRTGKLFAGDVGQDLMEEIDIIERGKNYGWNIKEGSLCFDKNNVMQPLTDCSDEGPEGEPLADPFVTYPQPETVVADRSKIHGIAVIGGRVYRGSAVPELRGAYVFGDWSRSLAAEGVLLVSRPDQTAGSVRVLEVQNAPQGHIGHYIRGFGQDNAGEVYVLTSDEVGPAGASGAVWRVTEGE
jgi:glucose/arabinose dehydrogenase